MRKTAAAAKQTADCTALQSQMTIEAWNHRTIEPSNHRTKNLKWIMNMVCCRRMPGSNQTASNLNKTLNSTIPKNHSSIAVL